MRKILNINSNWKFIKEDKSDAYLNNFDTKSWETVNVPHTWNAIDGANGNEYFKGACWYRKELSLDRIYQGKKIYIEFGAVNSISDVYVNGKHLGQHKGGYSIFRYDITDVVKFGEINTIAVKADNTIVDDVYPLMADFTFYGGMYRDVNIIVTEDVHFDLMDKGSLGVYISQDEVTNEQAKLTIKTKLTNDSIDDKTIRVWADIVDAQGNLVKCIGKDVLLKANANDELSLPVTIENPILWNGVKNPYLYNVNLTLTKDNDLVDELNIPMGLRYFHFDANEGFFLNGEHMKLQGVSRHQDKKDKGWAISEEDQILDMELIKEVGANSIRLAHYQHSQFFYDLCDKEGMVVWAEIPFISVASKTDLTGENAKSQMVELIRQNFNHPSIIMWGVENEIQIGGDRLEVRQMVKELNDLTHKEDPTRLTTQANVAMVPDDDEYNYYTDIIAYNKYYGWYTGKVEEFATWLDSYHAINPDRCLGLSEYGAEGIIKYHTDSPDVGDYTEEYHALYHETLIKIFEERSFLWGTYVWNFFDFGSAIRDEGGVQGRNNKGLVTFDRKIKKDGFYAYKAAWSKDLFAHIASKRFIDRASDTINIKVYSNCDEVTLFVNNEKVQTLGGKYTFVFENVKLVDGHNDIKVIATKDGKEFSDYAFFNKVDEPNPAYECTQGKGGFAANWFDEDLVTQYDNVEITELNISDDVFSSACSITSILENEEAKAVFEKYFAKLLDSPMIEMLKDSSIDDIAKMASDAFPPKLVYVLNRDLCKIKKS